MDDSKDQFPVGMRVLAVDDDPTCLMVLERLLRRCQYHVTVAKNAIAALKLLRENKNKFDLVISDVHMPDMDGFKLLELVGLEMDLPVIMLSVNGDPKMVMKGITHGACDYLLKPVRIEEIRNIWQHVIRRKKIDSKEKNKTSNQDTPNSDIRNGSGAAATVNSDQNEKPSKRMKDQDEDDDEGHENEDASTQKKPRVVWSPELHRKFVDSVHQLGVDKAVPKKILDLMNVEKLTRENVASHLQKYRLYLKKYSSMANQQANMVAALGGADSSYMRLSSLSGVGHLQTLSGSRQCHNNAFRSFPPGGMISRLNTPASMNVDGLLSSRTLQLGHAQKLNNSTNDQLKFQSAIVHGNQNGVQGMPMSVGLDQFQHNKGVGRIQNLTTIIDAKKTFPFTSKLPDQRPKVTLSCSPVLDISKNAMMLEAYPQDKQTGGVYNSQFSLPLLDNGKCNDIWSSAAMPPTNNMTTSPLQGENLSGASSIIPLSCQPLDSLTNMHSQDVIFTNTPEEISSNAPFQEWDNHNQESSYHSHVIDNTIGSIIPMNAAADPEGHTPMYSTFNRNLDFKFCDPLQMKQDDIIELNEETSLKPHPVHIMNQHKSQNSCISNNLDSLEDVVSAMIKQKR